MVRPGGMSWMCFGRSQCGSPDGAVFFDVDASSPWCGVSPRRRADSLAASCRTPNASFPFTPSCRVPAGLRARDGSEAPFRVDSGDVLVVPGGAPHVMASSPELRSNPDLTLYYRPVDAHLPFSLTVNGGGGDRPVIDVGERLPFSLISHGGGRRGTQPLHISPLRGKATPPRGARERNTPVTYAASSDATPVRSTPCSPLCRP